MIISQIFMTLHGKTVYYLFANEHREAGAPNISLNLLLQRQAIEWALQNKAEFYDLSGYKRGIDKTDSYWGVKVFKDKFPGEIVDFFSPVFIFE
jgi:lipid II:glycine glycyltransferase (peptidoglycan interpeptide bridge formation enzyme)